MITLVTVVSLFYQKNPPEENEQWVLDIECFFVFVWSQFFRLFIILTTGWFMEPTKMETLSMTFVSLNIWVVPTQLVHISLFSLCLFVFCFVLFLSWPELLSWCWPVFSSGGQWERVWGRGGLRLGGVRQWGGQGEEAGQRAGRPGWGAGVGQVSTGRGSDQILWWSAGFVFSSNVKWGRNTAMA